MSKDERCVDHCAVHALSSPTDPSFKANCDHVHNMIAVTSVRELVYLHVKGNNAAEWENNIKYASSYPMN